MRQLIFGALLAASVACQSPNLESKVVEQAVLPISPVPENWESLHNARYFPGPVPQFPGGYPVPGPGPITLKRPDPSAAPVLVSFTADRESGKMGEPIHFTAILAGDLRMAKGPLTIRLDTGDLLEEKFSMMFNDGHHNDGSADDSVWGLTLTPPRDTVSTNAVFTATALMGREEIGTKKTTLTLRGGDFQIRNGFERVDGLPENTPTSTKDKEAGVKTRGVALKDGVWTLHGGFAGTEGKLEGQFGVLLTASGGVLISPWLPGGSSLWFSTKAEGDGTSLEIAVSQDGRNWEPMAYEVKPRGGSKEGMAAELSLDSGFHGYIRWRLLGAGAIRIDGIRLLKRTFPPLDAQG